MREALTALQRGSVVAAATESLFGLLADATRRDALDGLSVLKPRGTDKGIPVLLPSREAWADLVTELPPLAAALADAFWPGPLTLALPAAPHVDRRLTLDGRIAVRLPGPSPATDLARALQRPLTATSANPPGEAPPTTALEVTRGFPGVPADRLFVLGDPAPGGAPSTVVLVDGAEYRVVRGGRISASELAAAAGLDPAESKR